MKTVKFYSGKAGKELTANVLEERKYTYLLQLEDNNIIVKKKSQVLGE